MTIEIDLSTSQGITTELRIYEYQRELSEVNRALQCEPGLSRADVLSYREDRKYLEAVLSGLYAFEHFRDAFYHVPLHLIMAVA